LILLINLDLIEVIDELENIQKPKLNSIQQARHPMFSGAYVSRNSTQTTSIQKTVVPVAKPLKVKNVKLKEKKTIQVNKNPSPSSIKIILRDFAKIFLSAGYNGNLIIKFNEQ
jgi:hypothetical protein